MSEKVEQMNSQLSAVVEGTMKSSDLDLVKLLNTEDPSAIEDTLMSSDKTLDEINKTETVNNVFTIGDKDQPIVPTSGKEKLSTEEQKKAEEQQKKQEQLKQVQDKTNQANKSAKSLSSAFNNPNISSISNLTNSSNNSSVGDLLNNIKKSINSNNYLKSSLNNNDIDPLKAIQNSLNNIQKQSITKAMIKDGFKSGNLLNKINTQGLIQQDKKSLLDDVKDKIKISKNSNLVPDFPSKYIKLNFDTPFNMHYLIDTKENNFGLDNNKFQQIFQSGIKWLAKKIGREIDCLLQLFQSGGVSDLSIGISLLDQLNNIKIFCDKHLAKHLGLSDEITKLVSSATSLSALTSSISNIGDALPLDVKKQFTNLSEQSKVLEQVDLLDKLVKFTAGYNNPTLIKATLDNNSFMKDMMVNISNHNIQLTTEITSKHGNYKSMTELIEQWGKYKIKHYKSKIMYSHINAINYDDTQFNLDSSKYELEPESFFDINYDTEPLITKNNKENTFDGLNIISLNKAKECKTFLNDDFIPSSIKDNIDLLNKIPIV